jgi:predicted transglutaminase-like cysteine proteinase
VAQRLIDLISEGAERNGRTKVSFINRAVNLAIRQTSDEAQWHETDNWSAPFVTLQSSRGDCEDYAIVKYLAMLAAGMSADDVKIVIVKNVLLMTSGSSWITAHWRWCGTLISRERFRRSY